MVYFKINKMKRKLLILIAICLITSLIITILVIEEDSNTKEYVITEEGVTWYTDTKQPQLSNPTPIIFVSDSTFIKNQKFIDSLKTPNK